MSSPRADRRDFLQVSIGTAAAALALIAGLGGVFDRVGGGDDGGGVFQTEASELAGGAESALVEHLGIREASGTVLDHLYVISRGQAKKTLGLV